MFEIPDARGHQANPGGGAATATQVEINTGTWPVSEYTTTIADPAVSPASVLVYSLDGTAAGRTTDDITVDDHTLLLTAAAGEITVLLRCLSGALSGKYRINYIVGA